MGPERNPVTLKIYFESNESQEPESEEIISDNSSVSKLTFPNVAHPEWAARILERTMYIQKVIDYGTPKNDPTHYGIAVVYRHEKVSDISKFAVLVRMAIENGGVSPPHL